MRKQKRIPRHDAFALYVALGHERSFERVAEHYGVSRRGIQFVADRDKWTKRLREIEAAATERVHEQMLESVVEMRTRHLQTLRVVSARALEALRDHPIRSGMDAVRAIKIVMTLERAISAESIVDADKALKELLRREEDTLLVDAEYVDGASGGDDARMVEVEVCAMGDDHDDEEDDE